MPTPSTALTKTETPVQELDLPDLIVGVVQDTRTLVEKQVGEIRADLGERLSNLGSTIKSWLVIVCIAIVTAMMLGLAIAETLTDVVGLPRFASMWIVTGLAVAIVFGLVVRARKETKPHE